MNKIASKVYVILVNYMSFDCSIECLESLLKSTYDNFQIIIIDNSENNESVQKILEWSRGEYQVNSTLFPDIVHPLIDKEQKHVKYISESAFRDIISFEDKILLVKAENNHGFSAANNVALKLLLKKNDFDFLWLLNNDTIVEKNTLSELIFFSQKQNERVGIIGAKLLYYSNPNLIQAIGGKYNKVLGTGSDIGDKEFDEGQYDDVLDNKIYNYIVGASMFVRREFINEVGLMPEEYFVYYEEVDWALKGKSLNWNITLCASARVYHKVSATTSGQEKKSKLTDFYSVRNRFIVTRKFYPHFLPIVLMGLVVVILKRLIRFQFDRVPLVIRAAYNGLITPVMM